MIVLIFLVGVLLLGGALLVALSLRRFLHVMRARPATRSGLGEGRIHVRGRAVTDAPLVSPWSGEPAVWYKVTIETYGGIRSRWSEVGSVARSVPHCLVAAEGHLRLDLGSADIIVSKAKCTRMRADVQHPGWGHLAVACGLTPNGWGSVKTRVIEERLAPGDELHAFGFAERRAGPPVPDAFRQAPTTELVMQPQVLTDKSRAALLALCATQLVLGVVMFVAGAVPVLALIFHR